MVSQRLQGGYHDWQLLSSFIYKEEPNFSDLGQSLGFEFCMFKSSDLLTETQQDLRHFLHWKIQTFEARHFLLNRPHAQGFKPAALTAALRLFRGDRGGSSIVIFSKLMEEPKVLNDFQRLSNGETGETVFFRKLRADFKAGLANPE